jgi:hypothetical protein
MYKAPFLWRFVRNVKLTLNCSGFAETAMIDETSKGFVEITS